MKVKNYAIEPGANLEGANLARENLRGVNLHGANLRGADLKFCDLRFADLRNADLTNAILTGALLDKADLGAATLENSNLLNASLRRAYLSDADLSWANLKNAVLLYAELGGAVLEDVGLNRTVGNGVEIKSIQGSYAINYTTSTMWVDSISAPIENWWSEGDQWISGLGDQASTWWEQNKSLLQKWVQLNPAVEEVSEIATYLTAINSELDRTQISTDYDPCSGISVSLVKRSCPAYFTQVKVYDDHGGFITHAGKLLKFLEDHKSFSLADTENNFWSLAQRDNLPIGD